MDQQTCSSWQRCYMRSRPAVYYYIAKRRGLIDCCGIHILTRDGCMELKAGLFGMSSRSHRHKCVALPCAKSYPCPTYSVLCHKA